ncbi:hypothetical protein BDY24DRAFT_381416 [Mrakia frigida]|uniref:uncharacterized protein n=1 Tax=Mrakia frigida TaxID=29902 RepID=UPI003FCC211B
MQSATVSSFFRFALLCVLLKSRDESQAGMGVERAIQREMEREEGTGLRVDASVSSRRGTRIFPSFRASLRPVTRCGSFRS